jgi:hypothetical protein
MDYLTAVNTGILKSGSVVAFSKTKSIFDKWIQITTGKYYHTGIIYIDPKITNPDPTKDVQIFEADYRQGVRLVKFGGGFVPFDIVRTFEFTSAMRAEALSLLGSPYSWINFVLVAFRLNSTFFGYICSTLVAQILKYGNENINSSGLTPTVLVNDLIGSGKIVATIDSF